MTPQYPRDRTSREAPPGRAEAAPAAPQSYLRALASALGRGPAETGRPIVAALRSLLRSAGEALGIVAPGAEPPVEPRARRVAEPPPAPLVEPIERPGLAPARHALERLMAVARSPALGAVADLYPSSHGPGRGHLPGPLPPARPARRPGAGRDARLPGPRRGAGAPLGAGDGPHGQPGADLLRHPLGGAAPPRQHARHLRILPGPLPGGPPGPPRQLLAGHAPPAPLPGGQRGRRPRPGSVSTASNS